MRYVVLLPWSCVRLTWTPPTDFLDTVSREAVERRGELDAHEACVLLHGLVMLKYIPEPGIMSRLLPQIEHILNEEQLLPSQVSVICWALPRLTPSVGPRLQEALPALTLLHLHRLPNNCLAHVLWAVAR